MQSKGNSGPVAAVADEVADMSAVGSPKRSTEKRSPSSSSHRRGGAIGGSGAAARRGAAKAALLQSARGRAVERGKAKAASSVQKSVQKKVSDSPAKGRRGAAVPFAVGDYVVYPSHGVGRVKALVTRSIDGVGVTFICVEFEQDRMTLEVPASRLQYNELRGVSSADELSEAYCALAEKSRPSRVLWSRRAQEYGSKIRSGDPRSIAEVIRDLHCRAVKVNQSFSERQLYRMALERLAREVCVVEGIDEDSAMTKLKAMLPKVSAKAAKAVAMAEVEEVS